MLYLSGAVVITDGRLRFKHPNLGYMMTPDMGNAIPNNVQLAIDNGCFTNPAGYSDERYRQHLLKFPPGRTLFATAPDVLKDHYATVERATPILRMIRKLNLPAAFVAQDGWNEGSTPWHDLDAIFIGGSTEFKYASSRHIVQTAKRHKKWVHMGRVNSFKRLYFATVLGCDSVDGTYLRFGPDINGPKLLKWLNDINERKGLFL